MKKITKLLEKDPYFGWILVAPILIWMMGTLLYPLFEAIILGFKNVGYAGTEGHWVGLKNYLALFSNDIFIKSLWITLIWTVANVVLQIGIALIGAKILNQDFFGKNFIRNWIIIPWVLPSIVLATLGKWILDPSLGIVNYILKSIGLIHAPISFLSDINTALPWVILLNVWRWFPFFLVMFLAALQTVPKELYEATEIEQANAWQKFYYVELPEIMPILKIQILLCALWAANIFDTIWLLTRGGPSSTSTTLPILIYLKAFQEYRISQASTIAVVMFIILLVGSFIYFRRSLNASWEEQ